MTRARLSLSGRCALVAFVVMLVAAACTGGGDDDADPTATTDAAPTAATSTTSTVPEVPEPEITPTTEAVGPSGRVASSVFVGGIRSPFTLVELESAALAAVTRQFTVDERVAAEVTGVDARVVRRATDEVGAVVALAVDPESALDEQWRTEFEAGLAEGAIRPPSPTRVGTEPAITFPVEASDGSTITQLLWRWDNVFVLMSGVDAADLDDAAFALLDVAVGPFPTTTTQPPTTTTTTIVDDESTDGTTVDGATTTEQGG